MNDTSTIQASEEDSGPNSPPRRWSPAAFRLFAAGVILLAAIATIAPYHLAQRRLAGGDGAGEAVRVFSGHDLVEHFVVMRSFDKVLRSGVLYPRWLDDFNNGYGIAWTNFYPPASYYLASLVHAITGDWLVTLSVVAVLVLAASGLAFYALAREFVGRVASLLAALIYLLLPFHVLNLYWQGAMPQFAGFAFLPLVFYFAYRLGARGRLTDFAGLGLCYGLYVLTHLPLSFFMGYTVAFYAVVWAARDKDWRIAARIAGGMGLGLLLGAIYWLPALLESKYSYENVSSMFPYHNSYLLLISPSDPFINLVNHSFMLQLAMLVAAGVILRGFPPPAAAAASRSQIRLWLVCGVATTFMATSLSLYVSKLIPKIEVGAFAWRWVAIASLFTALLFGAAADRLLRAAGQPSPRLWAGRAVALILVGVGLWLTVWLAIGGALANPMIKTTAGLLETNYTPRDAAPPTALPDGPPVTISPEGGASQVIAWAGNRREVVVSVGQPSRVRLKTYNFPGWTAHLDNQPVPFLPNEEGVQLVEVPAGRHTLTATFENTAPRTLGGALSSLGVLTVFGLALAGRRRERWRRQGSAGARADLAIAAPHRLPLDGAAGRGEKYFPSTLRPSLLVGTLLVLCMILMAVFVISGRRRGATALEPPGGNRLSSSGSFAAGALVRLDVGGGDAIPVATNESGLGELISALSRRDSAAVEALVAAGKVFRVPPGTTAKVVETGTGKVKLRIAEGEHILEEGWVPERWMK